MTNKKSLSEQIGLWDKGPIDQQQKQNTLGEIKRAFDRNIEMHQLLNSGHLQLNTRGSSVTANESIATNDVDIQAVFSNNESISILKDKCFSLLKENFGEDNVSRHRIAIRIEESINRRSTDLVVCKNSNGKVIAYNDALQNEVEFSPSLVQKNIEDKNKITNSKYSKMVRVCKSIIVEMVSNGEREIKLKSFAIESLLYNLKPRLLNRKKRGDDDVTTYRKRFCAIIQSIEARLKSFESAQKFKETDGISNLFNNQNDYNFVKQYWKDMRKYIKDNYDMGA